MRGNERAASVRTSRAIRRRIHHPRREGAFSRPGASFLWGVVGNKKEVDKKQTFVTPLSFGLSFPLSTQGWDLTSASKQVADQIKVEGWRKRVRHPPPFLNHLSINFTLPASVRHYVEGRDAHAVLA